MLTEYGSMNKLGTYSTYVHKKDHIIIINLYSQYEYGRGKMQTNYMYMLNGLERIKKEFCNSKISDAVIGIPYGIGCGLGGGEWKIVDKIINKVFKDIDDKIIICRL